VNTLGEMLRDVLEDPRSQDVRANNTRTFGRSSASPTPSPTRSCQGRGFVKGSPLPFEIKHEVDKLVAAIGSDADEGTPGVIVSLARRLPCSSIAKVRESVETKRPRNRAGYAVAALKSEIQERADEQRAA
jgi:hypothetical protein